MSDGTKGDFNASLYQAYRSEREEILKYKRLESEKAGHDIGFEQALIDWMMKHRAHWLESYWTPGWMDSAEKLS